MSDKEKEETLSLKEKIIKFFEDHRVLVIVFFVLPMSLLFSLYMKVRKYIQKKIFGGAEKHDERVKNIQELVKKWDSQPADQKKLLCTARPVIYSLSLNFFNKKLCHRIPVNLFNILSLDLENLTVRVEPMVSVGDIADFLIPQGYTLAVTLEMREATLGGLAMASAMTTNSHKVGLYHESVESYEVVLPDGSFVIASRDQNTDLYNTLPWSHGSIAFLVALTLKIIPIKPYIKMTFTPFEKFEDYVNEIRNISGTYDKDLPVPDYIEATIYSHDKCVLMTGEYSDLDPKYPVNHVARWYKPWFFRYVETFLKKGKSTELIPIEEYLLRYNRAIFWVVESMIPFGNNPLFRYLFGWLLPPKVAFLKFTTTSGVRELTLCKQIFQDIVMPIYTLEKQIQEAERLFQTYPLLVYPCRIYDKGPHCGQIKQPRSETIVPGTNYGMYNDIGIYGVPGKVARKEKYNPITSIREFEKFSRENGGFSFLYADILMKKEEFEETFDLTEYDEVRKKYKSEHAFPHLYEKVKPEIDIFALEEKYDSN